jgi:hypothetical protein
MYINQRVEGRLNYRHFDRERVPFAGNSSQITSKEYDRVTRRIKICGYGLFDAEQPEQRHFGRTLADLLNRSQLEQYVISVLQPYHYVVGRGEQQRLVLKIWVMWYEQVDVSRAAADAYAKTGELPDEESEIADRQSATLVQAAGGIDKTRGKSAAAVDRADGAGRTKKSGNRRSVSGIRQIRVRGGGSGSGDSGTQSPDASED